MPRKNSVQATPAVMILGVGSFAHSIGAALADAGAKVSTYLTRNYGHFPPSLVGPTFSRNTFPSPVPLLKKNGIEVVIPQSIDWALQPWAEDLLQSGVGIFSPTREAMRIERERDFARKLCADFKIPFPPALRCVQSKSRRKNPGETSAAVRHQKSALLADQPDSHDFVRDGRGHAGVAAARQLCRGRFLAGIPGPRRSRPHRAGERRRNSFARHEPGIQIRLQRQPGRGGRRAAGRPGRTRSRTTNTDWRASSSIRSCRGCARQSSTGRCRSPPSNARANGTSSNTTSASASRPAR